MTRRPSRASELTFLDGSGSVVGTVPVKHVNQRGGVTFLTLPSPVTAQRVRWQVTRLGASLWHRRRGGDRFLHRWGSRVAAPRDHARGPGAADCWSGKARRWSRPLKVTVNYPYAEPVHGVVRLAGAEGKVVHLKFGSQSVELSVPAVEAEKTVKVEVEAGGRTGGQPRGDAQAGAQAGDLPPAALAQRHRLHGLAGRRGEEAEQQHRDGAAARQGHRRTTRKASRFKWNVEVLWCVDNYLRAATPEKRAAFMAAVKSGQVGLDAFYCNILAGLCRPEELLNLMSYATRLSDGVRRAHRVGDDQRRAGLHLEHRVGHGAGRA